MQLTKSQLLNIINNNQCIGRGTYGKIYVLDDNTLFKFYYKDLITFYSEQTIEALEKELEILKEVYSLREIDKMQELNTKLNRINSSKANLSLQSVTLEGILIGVTMNYFKEYDSLYNVYPTLTNDQKIQVLNKVREIILSLIENNIYPRDIHEKNILIRKKDLDIKLIDLDDSLTRCEEPEYIETHQYIKNMVFDNESSMIRRLKLR